MGTRKNSDYTCSNSTLIYVGWFRFGFRRWKQPRYARADSTGRCWQKMYEMLLERHKRRVIDDFDGGMVVLLGGTPPTIPLPKSEWQKRKNP